MKLLTLARDLRRRKARDRQNLFVAEGVRTVEELLDAMAQDKKVKGGALTFILAQGIGQSFIAPGVAVDDVRSFLAKEISVA